METFLITNIKNAKGLAAKMRRNGYNNVRQYKRNNVITVCERKPWAVLAGYVSSVTEVIPCRSESDAEAQA